MRDDLWVELIADVHDPKYRFDERVARLMGRHNLTLKEARKIVTTVIYTKETDSRCQCGEVAQFVLEEKIYCGKCKPLTVRKKK